MRVQTGANSGRRLLLVTYYHPPIPFLGGDPWSGLTTHLRKLGHDLTIVTTGAHGDLPTDAERQVVRTLDLTSVGSTAPCPAPTRSGREGDAPAVSKAPPGILTQVVVPDAYLLSWAAWAAPKVRALIRRRQIECVITTSPPDSTHAVGLALGRDRPAWIADFRDGWTFEPLREPFPTNPQRRLDRWLEAQVVRRADRVTGPTVPLMEDFRARLGRDGGVVSNAWDTDLEPEVARAGAGIRLRSREPRLHRHARRDSRATTTGRCWRRCVGWFATIRIPPAGCALVIAGRLMDDEAAVLAAPDLQPIVQLAGALPRTALSLSSDGPMRCCWSPRTTSPSSTASCSSTSPRDGRSSHWPATTSRPGSSARHRPGRCVAPDDVEAIVGRTASCRRRVAALRAARGGALHVRRRRRGRCRTRSKSQSRGEAAGRSR